LGSRRDRDAWLEAIEHMRQVGVANIKPAVADQVADYLKKFWSGFRSAEIAGAIAAISESQAGARLLTDDALNIVYCRLSVDGEPKDRPGTGKPDKDGNIWVEMGGGPMKLIPQPVKFIRGGCPIRLAPSFTKFCPLLTVPFGSPSNRKISSQDSIRAPKKFEDYGEKYDGPPVAEMEPNAPWPSLRYTTGGQRRSSQAHGRR